MRKLDALEALARLAVAAATDRDGALSEATRIVGAAIGSDDVRLITGDGVSYDSYPRRDGEDFFGLSPEGMLTTEQECRRVGRAAVFTVGGDGQSHQLAPADDGHTGTYLGFTLCAGQTDAGIVVAHGPWRAAAACPAGQFLEAAGPALAIMLEIVADTDRADRLQKQMNSLADVAQVFTRAESMREVLENVVRAVNSATGFLCSLDLIDKRGRITMRSAAAGRFQGTPLHELYEGLIRAPDPLGKVMIKNRQPSVALDLQNDPLTSEAARAFYRRAGLVSSARFPLLFQDEVIGVLRAASLKPASYEPPTFELLRNLALQAAVVVKGAQLWRELQRSRKKLQSRNQELLDEISERQRAEEALRLSEEMFRDLVENISEVICTLVEDGRVTYVSPVVEQIAGYSPAEVVGRPIVDFIHPDDLPLFESLQTTVSGILERGEFRILTKSGETRWVSISSRPIPDGDRVVGLRAVIADITDRKRAEDQVKYQAYHDVLTGLPNRRLLMDRFAMALAQRRRDHHPLAVMFLDLDRFKPVNDTGGHAVGDELLQRVAERLTKTTREGDTVSRMGGDEFIVLLPEVAGVKDTCEIAERVLERFRPPWVLAGHQFNVTASIGIAMYPQHGEDPETLLRNADTATYLAKDRGRDSFELFASAVDVDVQHQVAL